MSYSGSKLLIDAPLLPSSIATKHCGLLYGASLMGLARPKSITRGTFKAAAIWPGPVSLEMTRLAPLSKATSSLRVVLPARFVIGTLDNFIKVSTAGDSEAEPVAIME